MIVQGDFCPGCLEGSAAYAWLQWLKALHSSHHEILASDCLLVSLSPCSLSSALQKGSETMSMPFPMLLDLSCTGSSLFSLQGLQALFLITLFVDNAVKATSMSIHHIKSSAVHEAFDTMPCRNRRTCCSGDSASGWPSCMARWIRSRLPISVLSARAHGLHD